MTIQSDDLNGSSWLTTEQLIKVLVELATHARSKVGKNLQNYSVVVRAAEVESINFEVVRFADAQRKIDERPDMVSESEAVAIIERGRKMRKFAERAQKHPVSAEEFVGELRAFGDIQSGNACFRSFGISTSSITQDGVPHNLNNTPLPKEFDARAPHRINGVVVGINSDVHGAMNVRFRLAQTFDAELFEKTDLLHRDVLLTMQQDDLLTGFVSLKDGVTMTVDAQLRITTGSDGIKFSGHVLGVINSQELRSSIRTQLACQAGFDAE